MYEIRPGKKSDLADVIRIGNNSLGQGYISESDFLTDQIRWLTVVYERQPIGFCIAVMQSPEQATKMLKFPVQWALNGERFGYMRTTVIHADHQGLGLGKRIFSKLFDQLISEQPDAIYGRAWHNHDKIPARRLILSYGFEHQATILSPWIDVPLDYHICEQPSCICHAGLFVYHPKK
jgi:ribosomal protein S18 acetylase RimI-like enzyme